MNRFTLYVTLGCLMAATRLAFAVDCNNLSGTLDLQSAKEYFQCSEQARQVADKKLNATYQELMKVAKEDPETGNDTKAALREAQRQWVVFRDKECDLRTAVYGGASQWLPYNHSTCLTDLTQDRTKTLQDYVVESKGR